jgi:hypothetical protein
MNFFNRLGEMAAGLFGGVETATQEVEQLGKQIVTWEKRRESLEKLKAEAYSERPTWTADSILMA